MIIMKFGGTSIQNKTAISRVSKIINENQHHQPVLVFSALGKTTRNLLLVARLSASNQKKISFQEIDKVKSYHLQFAEQSIQDFKLTASHTIFQQYFIEIGNLLKTIADHQEVSLNHQDKLLAYGELLSSLIITDILKNKNIPVQLLDARDFIKTDDWFTNANLLEEYSIDRVKKHVLPVVQSDKIPVVQGFIGSTKKGETTTLGFEGSDYTAAILGSALNADTIQIWKDVPGLMTADPDIFPNAKLLKSMTYDEAAELTSAGAKILHPRTISPAKKRNISIVIKDVNDPLSGGTIISKDKESGKKIATSITCSPVLCLNIHAVESNEKKKLIETIHNMLKKEHVSTYLIEKCKDKLALAITATEKMDTFLENFSELCDVQIKKNNSAITLVSNNYFQNMDIENLIYDSLKNFKIQLTHRKEFSNRITLISETSDVPKIIDLLHKQFITPAI